jgi:tRNA(fMet)-specific endonuclease VapC
MIQKLMKFLISLIRNVIKIIEFGKIQNKLRKIGKPTGQLDALIAAVAISQNYILVTDNTRDFENITK